MDKNTILDYATNSPENTNRNVLGSMLDQFSKNSGGGGDFVITHLGTGSSGGIVGDMTYGEIRTAMDDGKILIALFNNEYSIASGFISRSDTRLVANLANGWLVLMEESSGDDNNIWSTQD